MKPEELAKIDPKEYKKMRDDVKSKISVYKTSKNKTTKDHVKNYNK